MSEQAANSQSQQAADINEAFSGTENDAAPTFPPPVYDDQPEDNTGVNDNLNRRFKNIKQTLQANFHKRPYGMGFLKLFSNNFANLVKSIIEPG